MISSADFRGPLLGTGACAPSVHRGGATRRDDGGQPTVAGEIPWPPAGKSHGRQRGYFWPSTGRFSWPPTVEPALIARELLVAPDPAHGLVGLGARPLQIGPVQLGRLAVAVTAAVATARVPAHEAAGEHEAEPAQAGHELALGLDLVPGGLGHGGPSRMAHRGVLAWGTCSGYAAS